MTDQKEQKSSFGDAFKLLTKTTPFLILNLAVYGGFFIASVLWLGLFGGLALFFGTRIELLAIIFFIIAISGPFAVLVFGKKYILYLVQGAHIAVLTKLLVDKELPDNSNQVTFGRQVVQENFRDVSILFALDKMIDRVVKRFTQRFVRVVDWLPLGGGATQLAKWASMIVNRSLAYVDEAILSYSISRNEKNVWNSARHGIILYAQVYKPVLMTALKVWVLGRVIFVGLLIVFGLPGIALMLAFDAIWFQLITIVAILLITTLTMRAIFEPFAMAYTLVTYHHAIEGVEVNKEWDEKLQSVSGTFRKMVGKAKDFGEAQLQDKGQSVTVEKEVE